MRATADSLILPQGFIRRGSVYYRYYGDCMLQCIGFGYEPDILRKTVSFALMPLGALYPGEAFTPKGCPFQYRLSCVNRDAVIAAKLPEDELSALPDSIFPVLNNADSPEKLYDVFCMLDCKKYGRPDMLDPLKAYACLHGGQYQTAREIASLIVESYLEDIRDRARNADTDSSASATVPEVYPCSEIITALDSGTDAVKKLLSDNFEANTRMIKKYLHIVI